MHDDYFYMSDSDSKRLNILSTG